MQVRQFADVLLFIFMYNRSMLLDAMGQRVREVHGCSTATSRILLDPMNLLGVCFRPCARLQCANACWLVYI